MLPACRRVIDAPARFPRLVPMVDPAIIVADPPSVLRMRRAAERDRRSSKRCRHRLPQSASEQSAGGRKEEWMPEWMTLCLVLVAYFAVMRWVLPRLGVLTRMPNPCDAGSRRHKKPSSEERPGAPG